MLQKEQLFVLESSDVLRHKIKYQNISYERASEKAKLQFYKKLKFVRAYLNNVSILFYPTALCKLVPQKQYSKKRKMNHF